MKKLFFSILVLSVLLASCAALENDIVQSLGTVSSKNLYTSGGFQDFTDFAVYRFDSIAVSGNPYFSVITPQSKENILGYMEDFEGWVALAAQDRSGQELTENYTFDKSTITEDWYYCIDSKYTHEQGWRKYISYDLYLLDPNSNVLYYFHNNI